MSQAPSPVPPIEAVRWAADRRAVRIIDQRLLPGSLVDRRLESVEEVCEAIGTLAVRGAPAIGICGALGLVVSLRDAHSLDRPRFLSLAREQAARIVATRPTAVNLAWAVDRVLGVARNAPGDAAVLLGAMEREATAILEEDREMCRRIGENGAVLLGEGVRVLTHCNAGALATGGIGTALAPLYVAADRGLHLSVVASETRPLLQGSRLTAWELSRAGIPTTVVTDNMVASLMRAGDMDLCMVGADRIAANGDVANKIGTYAVAVLAHHHGIPFYVAAPWSTIDAATPSGEGIVIEERNPDEVLGFGGTRVAPEGVTVRNPAFDVTPAELVTAIISDRGIHWPPYDFATQPPSASPSV